jgi:hypothetical protein
MFCTKCGKKNEDHAKFCEYCGAKLEPVRRPEGEESGRNGSGRDSRPESSGRNGSTGYSRPAEPEKKNSPLMIIILVIVIAAAGVGAAFAVHYFMGRASGQPQLEQESAAQGHQPLEAEEGSSSSSVWAEDEPGTEETELTPSVGAEPTATPKPTATPEPTPTITVTAEPTPEVEKEHRYEFVLSDGSWQDAFDSCLEKGGYLARFETLEEYEKVTDLLEAQGLSDKIFYVGAARSEDSEDYYWVNGDGEETGVPVNDPSSPVSGKWLSGEPSYEDSGHPEICLTIYHHKDVNDWVLNDVPNDVVKIWSYYSGRMGYICEYES